MADANWERWQAAAQATYGLDVNGALRVATGIDRDVNGICRLLFGREPNTCFTEVLGILSTHALMLDGANGSFASTPDHASLDITGDIDVRIEAWYVPTGVNNTWLSKFNTGQRSYLFRHNAFAGFDFVWSTDGTGSVAMPGSFVISGVGAWRATLDADDGAAGRRMRRYTAPSMDGPWTQVTDDTVAGVTSIFAGTSPLVVGADNSGTAVLDGRVTRAQVRDGIDGTIVANPDFRNLAPGTTSFADSTGKTWTLAGGARVV